MLFNVLWKKKGTFIICVHSFTLICYHILQTMKKAQALIDMYKLENDAIKSFYPNFNAELQKYAQYKRLYFRADKLSLGELSNSVN